MVLSWTWTEGSSEAPIPQYLLRVLQAEGSARTQSPRDTPSLPHGSRDGCAPHLSLCALEKCQYFCPPAYLIRGLVGLERKRWGEREKASPHTHTHPALLHNLLEQRTSRALTAAVVALGRGDPVPSRPCPPHYANLLDRLCLLLPR